MYVMAFVGFLFVLCVHKKLQPRCAGPLVSRRVRLTLPCPCTQRRWMKREAVSDTRKRVTKHLREIDQPLDQVRVLCA